MARMSARTSSTPPPVRLLLAGLLLASPLAGCDPEPTPSDAGRDAAAPIDAGTDAGPPPVELCDPAAEPGPFPAPSDWGPNAGPGGPSSSFEEGELYVNCATLDGGELDRSDHHNLVTMFDGFLLMPWAPEFGAGGISFFDVSDPCAPSMVGAGFSPTMRESARWA